MTRTPFKNAAVEAAYQKSIQVEEQVEQQEELAVEQKTADRRIYWYVFALAAAFSLYVIPWADWATATVAWVKLWL